MHAADQLPAWAWRSALALALSAVLLILGLLAITLAGAADPQPLGAPSVEDTFNQPSRWQLSANGERVTTPDPINGHLDLSLSANGGVLMGLFTEPIRCPCTVELSAEQMSGGRDARFGLWWGDAAGQPVILVGVNSDGYMGITPGLSTPGAAFMDWQLFPHVRPTGHVNAFRADIDRSQVTVRLNDEVAARFARQGDSPISAGLFIQASPRDAARIAFLNFKTWETKSTGP